MKMKFRLLKKLFKRKFFYKQETKNDLSEFGVEPDAPDLFNNESEIRSNELLSSDRMMIKKMI